MQPERRRADTAVGQGLTGGAAPTAVSSRLVSERRGRHRLVVCNNGAVDIYLSKGDFAVSGSGYYLRAYTGILGDEPDPTGFIYTGPWSCITPAGTGSLSWSDE